MRWGQGEVGPEFEPEYGGWTLLREPSGWALIGIGLLVGLIVASAVAVAAFFVAIARGGVHLSAPTWPQVIVGLLVSVLIHELIHASLYPGGPFTRSVCCGINKGNPWVAFDGEMSRERRAVAKLAPVILLSVVPIAAMLIAAGGWWWLVLVALLNLWGSGPDMLSAVALLWRVPAGARVRDKESRTWWKTAQQAHQADAQKVEST